MFGFGDLWSVLKWCIWPIKWAISLMIKLFKTTWAFPVMFFIVGMLFCPRIMGYSAEGLAKAGMVLLGLIVWAGLVAVGFFIRKWQIKSNAREKQSAGKATYTAQIIMISVGFFCGMLGLPFVLVIFSSASELNIFLKIIYFLVGLLIWVGTIAGVLGIRKLDKKGVFDKGILKKFNALFVPAEQPDITFPILSTQPRGVMFGKKDNQYIIKPEELDGHIMVVGGVGSGKSSCIAIPTLRNWSESVFAIDIKGELYEKSKEYRQNIKVFNPLDESSCGYDPFFCLRTSRNPAQEARAIAQAIVPLPPEIKDPFWIESAQNIFTAAILHYSAQNLSFLDTIKQIQSKPPKLLIQELCESPAQEARFFVNSLTDMDDRTLSSIMAELSRNVVYFVTDKNLASALSREKNITPDDLEFGSDVYIIIPEHLLRQWKNLLTLIVNQFLTHFEQRTEANTRPILFLLDEFPRLGKISTMLDGLATLRSKKISICLIIQSLAQLDAIYGQNERKIISDTCAYKAILGATDADTQDYFSRLAGTYDKTVTSHGTSNSVLNPTGSSTSTNTQELEKRMIKPEEFGMLDDIILYTPFKMPLTIQLPKNSSDMSGLFPSAPRTSEISVPFARVEKLPYYFNEGGV